MDIEAPQPELGELHVSVIHLAPEQGYLSGEDRGNLHSFLLLAPVFLEGQVASPAACSLRSHADPQDRVLAAFPTLFPSLIP